ncbi:MAG: hypothetical protein A2V77_24545 [Anaeromyxobacter sp. RBG_16_69_14]|nr:MAG: hypothetical protein A2V77_24545 [Anaeromyxobacter sp. RBG_16_69_14]
MSHAERADQCSRSGLSRTAHAAGQGAAAPREAGRSGDSDRGEVVWEGQQPLDRLAVAPGGTAAAFADRSRNMSLVSLDDR